MSSTPAPEGGPGPGGTASSTTTPSERRSRGASARTIAAACLLFAFALGATIIATGFGSEARRLPLVIGLPLTVMSFANLIIVARGERRRHAGGDGATEDVAGEQDAVAMMRSAAEASDADLDDTGEGVSFWAALATVAVVTGMFLLIGLIPATVIFTLGYMRFIGGEPWLKSTIITAFLVLTFWLFRTFLNVRFYPGWLVTEDFIPYFLPF